MLIGFSLAFVGHVESFKAAALEGGRFLTPSETRQIFGDTFAGKYYNGNDYVDVTFRYVNTTSVSSSGWADPDGYMVSGRDVIVYSAPASGVNSNANYVTVDVQPLYSLFDFDMLYTAIGVSNGFSQNISAYQSPFWQWHIGGQNVTFEGNNTVNSEGVFPKISLQDNNIRQYSLCPVKYISQSLTSGYSLRAGFFGAGTYSGSLFIYIACPYITDGASGATGTFTSTTIVSSQGDINVNVDVDMTETNGLLGSVVDLLGGLVDGIAALFVPEQNSLEAFENALADLLMDTFGGIDNDMLINVIEDLLTHGATESVTFPALSVPGTSFSLPAYNVPLKPAAAQNRALYEGVALAIDLVATCAVLNLVQTTREPSTR